MSDGTKKCSKCGETLPLSEFHRRSSAPDGRTGVCRRCTAAKRCKGGTTAFDAKRQQDERVAQGAKLCSKCGRVRPLEEFCTDRARRDGKTPWCRTCRTEAGRSETERKRDAQWRKANRQTLLSKKRAYAKANRETIRQKQRRWWHEHGLQQRRKKKAADAEPYRTYEYNRRAKRAGREGKFTWKEFKALCEHTGNKCLRCGRTDRKLTADHVIPLSKGGCNTIANIQPLCRPCNSAKGMKTTDYRATWG